MQTPPYSASNSASGLQNQGLQIQWAMLQQARNRRWKLFYSPLSSPHNIPAPWDYTIKCISAHAQDKSHIQGNSGKNAQLVLCPPSGMGDLVTHFQALRLSERKCWDSGTYVRSAHYEQWCAMIYKWFQSINSFQYSSTDFQERKNLSKRRLKPFQGL